MRRKLLEVRKEFEEVMNDLEKDTYVVCWKTKTLGLPLISSNPKVLNGADKKKNSPTEDNGDGVKQKDSVDDEFGEEFETMVNTGHLNAGHLKTGNGQRGNGERSTVEEDTVPERPASGASNSKSCDSHCAGLLQINQCSHLEKSNTFGEVNRSGEEAICSVEQGSEKQRFLILNSNTTNQCDCPDERCPHKAADVPCTLNSTLKSTPGLGDEQEESETVGRESKSETSLKSYLQGGTPLLREQARLSDTWLTDRSFGKQLGTYSVPGWGGGLQYKRTPTWYQDPVSWTWLEMFFTPN